MGSSIPVSIVCLTVILTNSGDIKYVSEDIELAIGGNKDIVEASNEKNYAVKVLDRKFDDLQKKVARIEAGGNAQVEEIAADLDSIETTLEAVNRTSDELQKAIDKDLTQEQIISDRLEEEKKE